MKRRIYDPNHCTACGDFLPCGDSWIKTTDDLPDVLAGHLEVECCASGRCEVCSPGFDWGRDG